MVLKQIADEAYDTWMSSVPRQIGDANHPEYMASIPELVTGVEQGDDYQEEPLASHTTINSCQLIPGRCHELQILIVWKIQFMNQMLKRLMKWHMLFWKENYLHMI